MDVTLKEVMTKLKSPEKIKAAIAIAKAMLVTLHSSLIFQEISSS